MYKKGMNKSTSVETVWVRMSVHLCKRRYVHNITNLHIILYYIDDKIQRTKWNWKLRIVRKFFWFYVKPYTTRRHQFSFIYTYYNMLRIQHAHTHTYIYVICITILACDTDCNLVKLYFYLCFGYMSNFN